MLNSVIAVIESRQDRPSPALGFTRSLVANGESLDVVLQGEALRFALGEREARGFAGASFEPFQDDLRALLDRGAEVFYVEEDAARQGIERAEVMRGIQPVRQSSLAHLLRSYDRVWHW